MVQRFTVRLAIAFISVMALMSVAARVVGAVRLLDRGVLIYVAECRDSSGIYSIDIGHSLIVLLTQEGDADINRGAEWSPDGRQISFYLQSGFYVMDADGRNLHRLADELLIIQPSWTPDSQQIMFLTLGSETLFTAYIMNDDGSDMRLYPEYDPELMTQPTMGDRTGDGRAVSVQYRRGEGTELYVSDSDGDRRLTQNHCVERSPRWQP